MRSTRLFAPVTILAAILFAPAAFAAQYNDLIRNADQRRGGFDASNAGQYLSTSPQSDKGCNVVGALGQFFGTVPANVPALYAQATYSTMGNTFPDKPGGMDAHASGLDASCQLRYTDHLVHYAPSTPILIIENGQIVDATCLQPIDLRTHPRKPVPPATIQGPMGPQGAQGPTGPAGPQGLPGVAASGDMTQMVQMLAQQNTMLIALLAQQPAAHQSQPVVIEKGDRAFLNGLSIDLHKVDSNDRTDVDAWTRNNVEAWQRNTSNTNVQDFSRVDMQSYTQYLTNRALGCTTCTPACPTGNCPMPCPTGNCPPTHQCPYGVDQYGRCLPRHGTSGTGYVTSACDPRYYSGVDANGYCIPRQGVNGLQGGVTASYDGGWAPLIR